MKSEIIPVIHLVSQEQVNANIGACLTLGINKIFLINHGYGFDAVIDLNNTIYRVKKQFPELWVGVNYLQLNNSDALTHAINYNADALWSDDGGLLRKDEQDEAFSFHSQQLASKWKGQFFGGMEFKYRKQPYKEDLPWLYEKACQFIDVITTSGDGTGIEIGMSKLKRIRETIGVDKPLAVASGINAKNISEIAQYANYLMVASSVTDPRTELIDYTKLEELTTILNGN